MPDTDEIVMEESTATDNSAETRHVHKIDGKSIDEYTKVGTNESHTRLEQVQ